MEIYIAPLQEKKLRGALDVAKQSHDRAEWFSCFYIFHWSIPSRFIPTSLQVDNGNKLPDAFLVDSDRMSSDLEKMSGESVGSVKKFPRTKAMMSGIMERLQLLLQVTILPEAPTGITRSTSSIVDAPRVGKSLSSEWKRRLLLFLLVLFISEHNRCL